MILLHQNPNMAATPISRLLTLSKLHSRCIRRSWSLSGYVPRRDAQEFPTLRYDNRPQVDHVLVLPEPLQEDASSNEILRLPRINEAEIDFSKINVERVFKGVSQTINSLENFITDLNNDPPTNKSIQEILQDIEKHLYPVDSAFNILVILSNVSGTKYDFKEIFDLMKRYHRVRNNRFTGAVKECLGNQLNRGSVKLSPADRKMLHLYQIEQLTLNSRAFDESALKQYENNLTMNLNVFLKNLSKSNELFSHTVDDPDILSAVSEEFEGYQDVHHNERTPLKIDISTYQRFMELCPDRFVRQMLWQTCNKRCSPKSLPQLSNNVLIKDIRTLRRRISDMIGCRSHLEIKLKGSMAQTRGRVAEFINSLNEENKPKLKDRLRELNDYAADNSFEDPSNMGIQAFDVDYWSHRYMHEIIIGVNEAKLRALFPHKKVMQGLGAFFKDFFDIELKLASKPKSVNNFWSPDVDLYQVFRKGNLIGNIIYDPYQRDYKKFNQLFYGRVRARYGDNLPTRFISAPFKLDQANREAYLSFADITQLFYSYALVIQRLLYNYPYYELNIHGGLEHDANNLFPNLCVAHLLNDHKILQSCSDRGGSKPIDAELALRMLRASTYFKPFVTSMELYRSQLDLDSNIVLTDTKSLADEAYCKFSLFSREQDNYDFCSMDTIFVGPEDGTYYSSLWSKQLANFCISQVQDESGRLDRQKAKDMYGKLVDNLFGPDNLNTSVNLNTLIGKRFEPAKASLGVL